MINETTATDSSNGASAAERNRSSIVFPYSSLKAAEQIAEVLLRSWGGSATQDQIAGSLSTTPRSGTFRNKLGSARIFGAISVSRGNVKLTDLGHRLVDSQTKSAARVEAFLKVPLYAAIYDTYEGKSLPPETGLESKIAELGVSPKQTAKARQAMFSSARLAGFFDTDSRRLIRPAGTKASEPNLVDDETERETQIVTVNQAIEGPNVPLAELWLTLLNEGGNWSAEKTQDFVNTARKLRDVMARDG